MRLVVDAAKRKALPAWIREGLEKVEREKARKEEQERVAKRKEEAEALKEEERKEAEEEAARTGVPLKSKFVSIQCTVCLGPLFSLLLCPSIPLRRDFRVSISSMYKLDFVAKVSLVTVKYINGQSLLGCIIYGQS